jgi:hypothetical protein
VTYTFTGKDDPVSTTAISRPGITNTLAGAKSIEQCYPDFYQLDESMGTNIGNYSGLTPDAGISDAAACAGACGDNCVSATFVYTTGNVGACYLFAQGGDATMNLAVKALPFDTIGGSSLSGKAAVASGSYVLFTGHSAGSMYGLPITTIGASIGTTNAGTSSTATACKDACDGDSSCWGFYHDGSLCFLRTGFEAEGARSFMNMVGARVDTTNASTYAAYP